MQPVAQTTTRGSLAVSAGALEIAVVIQGALEVVWLYLYFYLYNLNVIIVCQKTPMNQIE